MWACSSMKSWDAPAAWVHAQGPWACRQKDCAKPERWLPAALEACLRIHPYVEISTAGQQRLLFWSWSLEVCAWQRSNCSRTEAASLNARSRHVAHRYASMSGRAMACTSCRAKMWTIPSHVVTKLRQVFSLKNQRTPVDSTSIL